MNLIRTTLSLEGEKGSRSEILKKWRSEFARRYERLFESGGYITRVAADEEDVAWGECIAASLQQQIEDLPEKWLYLIEHEGNYRCVLWGNNHVCYDDVVEASLLSDWLFLHNDYVAAYAHQITPSGPSNVTVIPQLSLDTDAFTLIEYKGSPVVSWAKKGGVVGLVIGSLWWMMKPPPPPPPPPEVLDPWHVYRTTWNNAQLAGDVLIQVSDMCLKLQSIPTGHDVSNGMISKGAIGAVLPDLPLTRDVLSAWANKKNVNLSFAGASPFISMPIQSSSIWSAIRTDFSMLDDMLGDLFTRLPLVSQTSVTVEPVAEAGVIKSRRANISITANPWLMREIGESLRGMPIMLDAANFAHTMDGNCSISNAVIQFEGSAS